MVLTANQTTSFFEDADQMGIPHDTRVQMQNEGITGVEDLADFDKDTLQQLADNLRKPGGRVPDPNPGAPAGATIPTPAFVFGAKSQKRLAVACDMVRYHNMVGRAISSSNMKWQHVLRNFEIQWKSLKQRKEDDPPEVPKISRTLPIIKWTEAFQDYLARVIGNRMIPLSYVIRAESQVPAAVPDLANNQPHSAEHGSVEAEMVARASHDHPLYRDDNAEVYYYIEEATRSTSYAASIKPFTRTKNGRGAWEALTSQYAGRDKWEAEIKRQEQLVHTRVWKGQSNQTLEQFVAQHRNAYVSMQAAAEHVEYQLPNEHSRVGFLLEAIQTSDAGLQAAMASIKTDTTPNGLRNNFESAVAHLLPYDPVAKKRNAAGNKRGVAEISSAEGADVSATTTTGKQSIGKTGVHLRYHTPQEYKQLSKEQKDELREWRQDNPSDDKKSPKRKFTAKQAKSNKKQVADLVAKRFKAELKKLEAGDKAKPEKKDDDNAIMSLISKVIDEKLQKAQVAAVDNTAHNGQEKKQVTLKSILKQAKNSLRE